MTEHIPEIPDPAVDAWLNQHRASLLAQHQAAEDELDRRGRRSAWAFMAMSLVIAAAGIGWALSSDAAEYTRDGGTADWMCCADKACATILSQRAREVTASDDCKALTKKDGVTRYVRSQAFRVSATVEQPVCPAKPADLEQTATCPAGSTGSWPQTRAHVSAPAPQCWMLGDWTPATPPADACIADLIAPALTATRVDGPNATHSVTLSWSVVAGAARYEIERCTGAGCTTFKALTAPVAVRAYADTNLPSGYTLRYRVRAVDATRQGPYSNVVDVVLSAAPPPPPPPPVTGSASASWVPPTQNNNGSALTNLAGYRLYVSAETDPPGGGTVIPITNAGITSYVVQGLSAGTWTFRVTAVTASGAESPSSNVVSKVVQ